MSKRKRRRFSDEFKADTVRLCQVGDRSIGQVAKDLDLGETAVRSWVALAEKNGWAGVVVFGCVRDTADLAEFDLGVLAMAAMPLRSEKMGEGQRDVPVVIANARVKPGDWVYVDEDGMVIAPRQLHKK